MLSEGSVVEAGHPHLLLQASAGTGASAGVRDAFAGAGGSNTADAALSSMVEETGSVTAHVLRRLAREAWEASGASEGIQGSEVAAS